MHSNPSTIVPLTPSVDQTDKRGYAITVASGVATIVSSNASSAYGVITDGQDTDGQSSVAIFGGNAGIVPVKLGAAATTVIEGDHGVINTDGTFDKDAGSGSRTRACRFTEGGVAGALVGAVLLPLQSLS